MFKSVDLIYISIEDSKVGRLVMREDRLCAFEYDPDWLSHGFSLSPFYLPLKSGVFTAKREPFQGLFGVFNDSLPDGWGNLLLDRLLMKQGIHPESLSVLDRLAIVGNSGMGALCYKPAYYFDKVEDLSDLNLLAAEIEKILNEDYNGSLELLKQKAGSSGGARPKVLIHLDHEDWMVKFRSSMDPVNIGELEFLYSKVAKKCGIEMPETRLFEGKYFGIRRFDRDGGKRIHMHTASGLLYASYRYPSLDYTELLKATMAICGNIIEVSKVFRLMVFNVLTGNKDDHAKNFSFLFQEGNWRLSPAYDLVLSHGFNDFHAMTIGGKGNPSKEDLFKVADNIGFPLKKAKEIFEEVFLGCKEIRLPKW